MNPFKRITLLETGKYASVFEQSSNDRHENHHMVQMSVAGTCNVKYLANSV